MAAEAVVAAVALPLLSHRTQQALCHKLPALQLERQDGSHLGGGIEVQDG